MTFIYRITPLLILLFWPCFAVCSDEHYPVSVSDLDAAKVADFEDAAIEVVNAELVARSRIMHFGLRLLLYESVAIASLAYAAVQNQWVDPELLFAVAPERFRSPLGKIAYLVVIGAASYSLQRSVWPWFESHFLKMRPGIRRDLLASYRRFLETGQALHLLQLTEPVSGSFSQRLLIEALLAPERPGSGTLDSTTVRAVPTDHEQALLELVGQELRRGRMQIAIAILSRVIDAHAQPSRALADLLAKVQEILQSSQEFAREHQSTFAQNLGKRTAVLIMTSALLFVTLQQSQGDLVVASGVTTLLYSLASAVGISKLYDLMVRRLEQTVRNREMSVHADLLAQKMSALLPEHAPIVSDLLIALATSHGDSHPLLRNAAKTALETTEFPESVAVRKRLKLEEQRARLGCVSAFKRRLKKT